MDVRVLVLDDPRHWTISPDLFTSMNLIATVLEPGGLPPGVKPSQEVMELARAASPELYDYVVIGNNWKTGLVLAGQLDPAMCNKSLIVHFDTPDEATLKACRDLGYPDIRPRDQIVQWLLEQVLPRSKRIQQADLPESCPPTSDPYCYNCGIQMQRAGSVYACASCGMTSQGGL